MPAGNVRPRASQVPLLDPAALEAWTRRGWHLTEHGRLTTGTTDGPCVRCACRTTRYGSEGHPFCTDCRPGHPAQGELANLDDHRGRR